MKALDTIVGLIVIAPVIWIAWSIYWHPLPRGRRNCPLSLIVDAVVRDSMRRK